MLRKGVKTGLHTLHNQVVRNIIRTGKTTGLNNIININNK